MNKIVIVSLLSLLSITGCGLVNVKTGFNTENKCNPRVQTCHLDPNYQQKLDERQAKIDAEQELRAQQEAEAKRLQAISDEADRKRKEEAAAAEAQRVAERTAKNAELAATLDGESKACVEWATKNRCQTTATPHYVRYVNRLTGAQWVETEWEYGVKCQSEQTKPENCRIGYVSKECVSAISEGLQYEANDQDVMSPDRSIPVDRRVEVCKP